jgi:hypothetical protein
LAPILGAHPLTPQEEKEDRENDMRVPFASLYKNKFEDVSNLGATAEVEVEKLGQ